jgi:N-acetylglucosamine-6-phosphate deacetylase
MNIAFTNANLWIGDGTQFHGYVTVHNGTISEVGDGKYTGPLKTIDLAGQNLSPGLIDLMVLGGFNKSILRDDPADILREYIKLGVTSCQVCSGTLPPESNKQVAQNVLRCMKNDQPNAARMLGYYMEGPFQAPHLTGASLKENSRPATPEHVQRVLEDAGEALTMVNVAPGIPGDADAVKSFVAAGKVVSMAHSDADSARIIACLESGTTVLGHVFDNNSGLFGDTGVQQPTIEHVALIDERVKYIHLICDGSHVHPLLVKLVLRCRGTQTIVLVTDCVPRAGCEDGPYIWDDGRHFYKKGGVGRTDKHGLTGSALLLPDHLRNFIKFTGTPAHQAIRTVTLNPALSIHKSHQIGILAPGRHADLSVWDNQLNLKRVFKSGVESAISSFAEIAV